MGNPGRRNGICPSISVMTGANRTAEWRTSAATTARSVDLVVQRSEGDWQRLLHLLERGVNGWLAPGDHDAHQVHHRREQEGPRVLVLGVRKKPESNAAGASAYSIAALAITLTGERPTNRSKIFDRYLPSQCPTGDVHGNPICVCANKMDATKCDMELMDLRCR